MSKKQRCHKLKRYQQERQEVENALLKLQRAGLVGESRVIDGELQVYVGPEHVALMREFLSHPEKWPDHWSDEVKAKAYALRDEAIAKGMVKP